MANIAEGFVRGGRKEFTQFVRIAAGSNAEARSLLHAAFGRRYLDKTEYERLVEMTDSIGRMLRVLEARLKEPRVQPSRAGQ
ncbi:MAG: four helix bundle protein [Acidobacteria bacterium]|nr:four helix bundle protein [Acidobacteriota bacterium]